MIVTLNPGRPDPKDAAAKAAMYLMDEARPDIAASGMYGEVFMHMRDLGTLLRDLFEEANSTGKGVQISVEFSDGLPQVKRA